MLKVMGKPELAVAEIPNVGSPSFFPGSGLNVIVWPPLTAIFTLAAAEVAAPSDAVYVKDVVSVLAGAA
jgi:hypothetical protein